MPLTDQERIDLLNYSRLHRQPMGSGEKELAKRLTELDSITRSLAVICVRLDDELRAATGQPPSQRQIVP